MKGYLPHTDFDYAAVEGSDSPIMDDDDEPFDAAQWELEPDLLQFGGMEYRRILDAFAHALANAFSEGYSQGIGTLKMPKWARLKMQRAQDEW